MSAEKVMEKGVREPVLSVVDRVSELLFGLFMALTFVAAVSVTDTGQGEIQSMFAAALGCNLAWGLVDAVMYLVRTVTDRGRSLTLVRSVRAAPDAETGRRLIERTLARDEMFAATDSSWAPWFVARSEDKKRVRLNVISHILKHVPYEALPAAKVKLPKRKVGRYTAVDFPFKYVPEIF